MIILTDYHVNCNEKKRGLLSIDCKQQSHSLRPHLKMVTSATAVLLNSEAGAVSE